jgi:Holliday junction resolvase RusA-like endonuclease
LDNYLKAINDALVKFGVIIDDSLIEHIEARFADTVKGVIVTLEEV